MCYGEKKGKGCSLPWTGGELSNGKGHEGEIAPADDFRNRHRQKKKAGYRGGSN